MAAADNEGNITIQLCGDSLDVWNKVVYLPPMVIKGLALIFILFGLVNTLLNVSILAFLVKTDKNGRANPSA